MKKLVIIDDDPIDHYIMKRHLENKSYFETTTFTTYGSLIIEYITENQSDPEKLPDVVFIDLNMPQYNGWEFLDDMMKLQQGLSKNIKVYVLTSSVRNSDIERANRYPFVRSFISKPVQPHIIDQIAQKQPVYAKVTLQ